MHDTTSPTMRGRTVDSMDEGDELRDEADDFEDALIAEMTRTGAIEIW